MHCLHVEAWTRHSAYSSYQQPAYPLRLLTNLLQRNLWANFSSASRLLHNNPHVPLLYPCKPLTRRKKSFLFFQVETLRRRHTVPAVGRCFTALMGLSSCLWLIQWPLHILLHIIRPLSGQDDVIRLDWKKLSHSHTCFLVFFGHQSFLKKQSQVLQLKFGWSLLSEATCGGLLSWVQRCHK